MQPSRDAIAVRWLGLWLTVAGALVCVFAQRTAISVFAALTGLVLYLMLAFEPLQRIEPGVRLSPAVAGLPVLLALLISAFLLTAPLPTDLWVRSHRAADALAIGLFWTTVLAGVALSALLVRLVRGDPRAARYDLLVEEAHGHP